jgi:hypothetical protein
VERQGHGVVNPAEVLLKTLKEDHIFKTRPLSPFFDFANNKIIFYYHDHHARRVTVAGSFNNWQPQQFDFQRDNNGLWTAEIPMPPAGQYSYKFIVDEGRWIDDPENPLREPDGYNGLNSRLIRN